MAKDNDDDYIDLDQPREDEEEVENEDRGDNIEDEEELEEDGEVEEDEEESSEEDEETEEDDEDDSTRKNIKIPKYRLDEEIAKTKALKEREKWLEAQLERLIASSNSKLDKEISDKIQETPFDFEDAEEKYISLLLEGETKEAVKLRRKIDSEREREVESRLNKVKREALEEQAKAKDDETFDLLVVNYEDKYKFFNRSSKFYNEEAVDTVNTLMAGYLSAGKTRSESLKLAVEKVAPLYKQPSAQEDVKKDKRTISQKKKNIEALRKQPPKLNGKRSKEIDSDDFDIDSISDKELSKLDRKTLAKLRGDII